MYEVKLTRKAQKFYEKADAVLARRLNQCFEQLQQNPTNHQILNPLKDHLRDAFVTELAIGELSIELIKFQKKQTVMTLTEQAQLLFC